MNYSRHLAAIQLAEGLGEGAGQWKPAATTDLGAFMGDVSGLALKDRASPAGTFAQDALSRLGSCQGSRVSSDGTIFLPARELRVIPRSRDTQDEVRLSGQPWLGGGRRGPR